MGSVCGRLGIAAPAGTNMQNHEPRKDGKREDCGNGQSGMRYQVGVNSDVDASVKQNEKAMLHTDLIYKLVSTDDGRVTLSCDVEGRVALYDWANKRCVLSTPAIEAHRKSVEALALSPANDRFFTGSRDKTVRLWALPTTSEPGKRIAGLQLLRSFEGHTLTVSAVCALGSHNAASQRLISGSRDSTVRFWDVESGALLGTRSEPRNVVTSLYAVPRDDHLAVQTSEDLAVRVWDSRSPVAAPVQHVHVGKWFALDAAVHPVHTHYFATAHMGFDGNGCHLALWDRRVLTAPVTEMKGHTQAVYSLQFVLHDQRTVLVSGSKDQHICLWDANDILASKENTSPAGSVATGMKAARITPSHTLDLGFRSEVRAIAASATGSSSVVYAACARGVVSRLSVTGIGQDLVLKHNAHSRVPPMPDMS